MLKINLTLLLEKLNIQKKKLNLDTGKYLFKIRCLILVLALNNKTN